ncbi:hypothetical protein [Streptomyces sp. NRRL S-920]|uniref:hypothetical protein n=1 Tax=Streptomyces sp. NRRL S-920 TaxID=1463921 RepID=UPI00131AE089|nr:hypothetical protein [Streptomyces sp. NRRL S-920]
MDDDERAEAETAHEAALLELIDNSWDSQHFLTDVEFVGKGLMVLASGVSRLMTPQYFNERVWPHDFGKVAAPFQSLFQHEGRTQRGAGATESARKRYRAAADELRAATTVAERRTAARAFLAALAELVACLLEFLVVVLLVLLSRLLGRVAADDVREWKPEPIEAVPQITPRGPNSAFPVHTHRGGHHGSRALGSAVLAA